MICPCHGQRVLLSAQNHCLYVTVFRMGGSGMFGIQFTIARRFPNEETAKNHMQLKPTGFVVMKVRAGDLHSCNIHIISSCCSLPFRTHVHSHLYSLIFVLCSFKRCDTYDHFKTHPYPVSRGTDRSRPIRKNRRPSLPLHFTFAPVRMARCKFLFAPCIGISNTDPGQTRVIYTDFYYS